MYSMYKVITLQHPALIIVISEYAVSISVIELPYGIRLSVH